MATDTNSPNAHYVVVARRYRPQQFSELIGQSQVATALSNAIEQSRVGHAYLFTGARGVGKTSAARIFAKCLNCQQGPTTEPCDRCDICEGIASGEDVDVLEIDGASNRGIDEIRQLRANAIVRPSRARFKIYIIDEVHMLTTPAFNALLKTLEEPPDHIKFIFCTTDPEKIPITVLSRCQRFDFPPIQTPSILERLKQIVAEESVTAEDEALELLARRAGGSMRDSQSLLEQLLSYSTESITVADVHGLLGTADISCVFEIAEAMIGGRAADSLAKLDEAVASGVDAGQLTEQLLGIFRDLMAIKVGCEPQLMLFTSKDDLPRLQALGDTMGLEKILAIIQILDQTLVKTRQSTYVRTLLETAIIRTCHLENIDLIPKLIQQLQGDGGTSDLATKKPRAPAKKNEQKNRDAPVSQTTDETTHSSTTTSLPPADNLSPVEKSNVAWDENNLGDVWRQVLAELGDVTANVASKFESVELVGNDQLVVTLKSVYDRELCCRPERRARLEQAIAESTGKQIRLDFRCLDKPGQEKSTPQPPTSKRQRLRQIEQEEFVRSAIDIFDVEILDVQPRRQKPK